MWEKNYFFWSFVLLGIMTFLGLWLFLDKKIKVQNGNLGKVINRKEYAMGSGVIKLPQIKKDGETSVEHAISVRRSIRNYHDKPLTLEQISQLLWAAQGVTSKDGLRAAPSAGALYPIEVYLVAGKIEGLNAGIYKYECTTHLLSMIKEGDVRLQLSDAAMGQSSVKEGAIDLVFFGVYKRTTGKYGPRANRYVHMEAGHVAQNIYLQAVSLGLGTVVVGAFSDDMVKQVIGSQDDEHPLYVMPVGVK